MNISKLQQRVLHALAQGGRIQHHRDGAGRLERIDCLTREGFRLEACDMLLFKKLKERRWIASRGGGPYGITRQGLEAVRSQGDNR
ncbi:MAG TPA: YjhX family toxin [Caulobacteraceae bacterium]|nr:YjhX family toxin [Caulobacteraceae bacterium]